MTQQIFKQSLYRSFASITTEDQKKKGVAVFPLLQGEKVHAESVAKQLRKTQHQFANHTLKTCIKLWKASMLKMWQLPYKKAFCCTKTCSQWTERCFHHIENIWAPTNIILKHGNLLSISSIWWIYDSILWKVSLIQHQVKFLEMYSWAVWGEKKQRLANN